VLKLSQWSDTPNIVGKSTRYDITADHWQYGPLQGKRGHLKGTPVLIVEGVYSSGKTRAVVNAAKYIHASSVVHWGLWSSDRRFQSVLNDPTHDEEGVYDFIVDTLEKKYTNIDRSILSEELIDEMRNAPDKATAGRILMERIDSKAQRISQGSRGELQKAVNSEKIDKDELIDMVIAWIDKWYSMKDET
jgi:hypothetical protein